MTHCHQTVGVRATPSFVVNFVVNFVASFVVNFVGSFVEKRIAEARDKDGAQNTFDQN